MNAFKKSVLATAVVMSMGAGAAQASVNHFQFDGVFAMFDGSATTFDWMDPANGMMDSGNGNNYAGDPVTGTMSLSDVTGQGSATMTGLAPFYGNPWLATGITLQYMGGGYDSMGNPDGSPMSVTANMMFNWGAAAATSCGLANCDIGVTVGFEMSPLNMTGLYGVRTVSTDMPAGPFALKQATFSGSAQWTGQTAEPVSSIPVPAAAWLLGSGLLGLVGVARRKAA